LRDTSPHHARASRAPLPIVFPGADGGVDVDRSPIRLLCDGLSGTTGHRLIFPLGLSSISALPVLQAELPLLWILRFHSPQTGPADRVPTFQSFGALRNLPCADGGSV